SPTKDYKVRPLHSANIHDHMCRVTDFNQRYDALYSSLARFQFRSVDDNLAAFLEHFVLRALHVLHMSQLRQLVAFLSFKNWRNNVQNHKFRAVAFGDICGNFNGLGCLRRAVNCDQNGFEGHIVEPMNSPSRARVYLPSELYHEPNRACWQSMRLEFRVAFDGPASRRRRHSIDQVGRTPQRPAQ